MYECGPELAVRLPGEWPSIHERQGLKVQRWILDHKRHRVAVIVRMRNDSSNSCGHDIVCMNDITRIAPEAQGSPTTNS
ncbi:unnamed protein product [Penicillium roqueforti FM164]|uniref:Str. FM013 n=2 Tax=Penicillium TaxID=5073 RepID=A0A0G4PZ12_PENC3|nr:unnamed protein product [Penicillium roqueforti FM164]CRL31412.1 unnamed protein product [Penicillium camemberti]